MGFTFNGTRPSIKRGDRHGKKTLIEMDRSQESKKGFRYYLRYVGPAWINANTAHMDTNQNAKPLD